MKKQLQKIALTLLTAGTLFATTGTALADTKTTTPVTENNLTRATTKTVDLATTVTPPKTNLTITPVTKTVKTQAQVQLIASVNSSSQDLSHFKYQPKA
ncbi:hypothetical protein [Lactiplantibacillus daowaiensis]|uniref:Extracellular protein n=1 Tax=Lactiplantibacillus daowaiensis TaxID=2559918 RepID=A0ABW1S0C9_9LACO|nr:hypothetical protein [Lactiplantibacillus daowaiensis]